MEFAPFDTRHYPTLTVQDGYREWAESYETTVVDLMDIRLLERLRQVDWRAVRRAEDEGAGAARGRRRRTRLNSLSKSSAIGARWGSGQARRIAPGGRVLPQP